MSILTALRMVWNGVNDSRSTCPDVSIDRVHTLLGQALANELEAVEPQEIRRFIMGHLLLSPLNKDLLTFLWSEAKCTPREFPEIPSLSDYTNPSVKEAIRDYYDVTNQEKTALEADAEKVIDTLMTEGVVQEDSKTHRISLNTQKFKRLVLEASPNLWSSF